MLRYLFAVVAVLVIPAAASACESVQALVVAPHAVYAAPAQLVAPVTYQAQIVAQPVVYSQAVVAQPVVVQNVIVKQQRQRRHPVRNTLRIVTPPFGHCR